MPHETADGMGGFVTTWSPHFEFKGRLSDYSPRESERLNADRETEIATHTIYTTINDEISRTWRITLDTRHFEVKSVHRPSNLSTGMMQITVRELT